MICDTNWCTFCDYAISPDSESLYCSENCFRKDASMRDSTSTNSNMRYRTHGVSEIIPVARKSNSESCLPRLIRQKASIPSLYCNQNNQKAVTTLLSNHVFISQCVPVSSMTPSLSSSISSSFSLADVSNQIYDEHPTFHHTIPQNSSYSILVERLNRAIIDL